MTDRRDLPSSLVAAVNGDSMTWKTRALCAGDGRFTSTDPLDLAEAVIICGSCPLTGPDGPCHAWAKTEDFEGVAAGRVWRGKQTTGSPANRTSKYHHWNADDMRLAHSRHAAGERTAWSIEGEGAYRAWRKRVTRKSRAA
jgi:hypothetical protein